VLKGHTIVYCAMQWCQAVPSLDELAQWMRKGFRTMVREQPAECDVAPQPTFWLTPDEALHQIVTAEIALRGRAPLKPKGGRPGEGEHRIAVASLIPALEERAHALGFLSLPITQTATARLLKGLGYSTSMATNRHFVWCQMRAVVCDDGDACISGVAGDTPCREDS
jgi:hypothetical protein